MTEHSAKIQAAAECYRYWRSWGETPEQAGDTMRKMGSDHAISSAEYASAEKLGESLFTA